MKILIITAWLIILNILVNQQAGAKLEMIQVDSIEEYQSSTGAIYAGLMIKHTVDESKYFPGSIHLLEHLILTDKDNSEFHQSIEQGRFNGITIPGVMMLYYKSYQADSLLKLYQRWQTPSFDLSVVKYEIRRYLQELDEEKNRAKIVNEKLFSHFSNETRSHSIGDKSVIQSMSVQEIATKLKLLHLDLKNNSRMELLITNPEDLGLSNVVIKDSGMLNAKPFFYDNMELKSSDYDVTNAKYLFSISEECTLANDHMEYLSDWFSKDSGGSAIFFGLFSYGKHTLYELSVLDLKTYDLELDRVNFKNFTAEISPPEKIGKLSDLKKNALGYKLSSLRFCSKDELDDWLVRFKNSKIIKFI